MTSRIDEIHSDRRVLRPRQWMQNSRAVMAWQLIVALLAIDLWLVLGQNCDDSDLKRCMDELKVLTNNQDLAFAKSEAELTHVCRHLQEAMQCINGITLRCFDYQQRELYRVLTSGAQELLSDLCTEGSKFRSQYLQHAECYKNLTTEYRRCSGHYLLEQEAVKKSEMNAEELLRRSCCLFDGYKKCTRTAVLSRCTKEAADVGEQIITKAGGPLVHSHCSSFKYESPRCASVAALFSASPASSLVLLSAVLFIDVF